MSFFFLGESVMKKSIILFSMGLGVVLLITFIYFLINHFSSNSIDFFKFFSMPLNVYFTIAVASKINCRILPKTISEISKFIALVFFSFLTMFQIFQSSDIDNSICLIVVIAVFFNWNTNVEKKNDNGDAR